MSATAEWACCQYVSAVYTRIWYECRSSCIPTYIHVHTATGMLHCVHVCGCVAMETDCGVCVPVASLRRSTLPRGSSGRPSASLTTRSASTSSLRNQLDSSRYSTRSAGTLCVQKNSIPLKINVCIFLSASFPGADDNSLFQKFERQHKSHPHYHTPQMRHKNPVFTIVHYASDVTYSVQVYNDAPGPQACPPRPLPGQYSVAAPSQNINSKFYPAPLGPSPSNIQWPPPHRTLTPSLPPLGPSPSNIQWPPPHRTLTLNFNSL